MRIALIHYRLILKGGLETRLQNYIQEFHKRGYNVTVICAKRASEVAVPEGVKVVKLSPGLTPKPLRKWQFSRLVNRYMKTHQFDFSLSLGRTVGQDAVLAPANHMGYMKAMGHRFWGFSDFMQHHLDKISFQQSKVIFAASEMMKGELVDFYNIPFGKIQVLFPPINILKFSDNPANGNEVPLLSPAFDRQKTSFLFVSVSHKRKGLDILLKVFRELTNEPFELFIAGIPAVKTGLKNVRYIGFIKDLKPWFSAADFTVHPARFEPFGQIITESIACGTPVLVSHKVGAKEIIGRGEGLVLDSLDPADWLMLIRDLKNKEFSIAPEAIEQKGLGLKSHVDRMLEIWINRPGK